MESNSNTYKTSFVPMIYTIFSHFMSDLSQGQFRPLEVAEEGRFSISHLLGQIEQNFSFKNVP